MVEAIAAELEMRQGFGGKNEALKTVYFGGGTPSLLAEDELRFLFEKIRAVYDFEKEAEITLEANPEDLSPDKLKVLASLGINRLSIGLQSFEADDLEWMNRAHTPEQAAACVPASRPAGIDNITVDLIFGLPGMDMNRWEQNLDKALALKPDHLSLYALSIEKKTAIRHWVKEGKMALPNDHEVEAQYLFAHRRLADQRYKHYELSSFSKPGRESRHNSAYWRGFPYLGLGPSAHSYDGKHRSWNHAHNAHYLKAIAAGTLPLEEKEVLSDDDHYNEYLMTRLRLADGLSIPEFEDRFETDFWEEQAAYIDSLLRQGLMWRKSDRIGLSPRGWIISDSLVGQFFR
jgi:oxygen-independent coproporphyrinogen-3 oxidase